MKTIYVLRHAKAEHNSKIDDHERPLAPEGLHTCIYIREYLHHHRASPEKIFCSTALRTRQTAEAILEPLGLAGSIAFEPKLYLATAGEIFHLASKTEDSASSLLVIGHNPGLHSFCVNLAAKGRKQTLKLLGEDFPPASLAVIECPITSWQQLEPGAGVLQDFFIPGE